MPAAGAASGPCSAGLPATEGDMWPAPFSFMLLERPNDEHYSGPVWQTPGYRPNCRTITVPVLPPDRAITAALTGGDAHVDAGNITDMSANMTDRQLRTWEKLQDVTELLRREVGRDLWNDAKLSEAEFTVLAHLSMGPRGTARPSECARAIGWDSSRLAHQLRRLEKRGLVEKGVSDAADGRASLIALTDEGRTAYRRALGPHLRSAQKWFADALSDQQVDNLADALEALLGHGSRLAAAPAADPGP